MNSRCSSPAPRTSVNSVTLYSPSPCPGRSAAPSPGTTRHHVPPDRLDPVDPDRRDADRLGVQSRGFLPQVVHQGGLAGVDALRVEQHEVRVVFRDPPVFSSPRRRAGSSVSIFTAASSVVSFRPRRQSPRKRVVYGAPHMRSRWAPASEPPSMTSGCCQVSARSVQESVSLSVGMGHSTVRRSSCAQTPPPGTRRAPGARRAAMSFTTCPVRPSFAWAVHVFLDDVPAEVGEAGGRHPPPCCSPGPASAGTEESRAVRAPDGSARIGDPGIRFSARTYPGTCSWARIGTARATTLLAFRARSGATSLPRYALGTAASMVSTFQRRADGLPPRSSRRRGRSRRR